MKIIFVEYILTVNFTNNYRWDMCNSYYECWTGGKILDNSIIVCACFETSKNNDNEPGNKLFHTPADLNFAI